MIYTKAEALKELRNIKSKLYKQIVCKNNYMVLSKETGEKAPFYDEVVKLNDVIVWLNCFCKEEGNESKRTN